MFICIEGNISHENAHGTGPEEVIIGGAKVKHPEAKAAISCDLDPQPVLGDSQYPGAPTVMLDFVTGTVTASKHAFATSLESGLGGPTIEEGV